MSAPGTYSHRLGILLVVVACFTANSATLRAQQPDASATRASDAIPPERLQQYSDLALEWMRES